MDDVILDLQDMLKAIERSHTRTGKLLERFHAKAEAALTAHGDDVGISPNVVVPKEPPE